MSPSLQARRECHWPGRDPLRGIPKRIWKMRDGDTRACASSSDMTPLLEYGIESPDLIHHAAINGIGRVIAPPVRHPCRQTREQLDGFLDRSEEHTSELQSLMRISYAVFCLKKKKNNNINN